MAVTQEIRNLLGLCDNEKRLYIINTDEVTAEEYEYCQILSNVLWGDKGLVETLGPTWNMIHDSRFENLERKFIVNRAAVFGGDARLGKQYVDGESIMSHSMVELESYAEILGEGRHFLKVVRADNLDAREFYCQSDDIVWKYIRQECPNYFDNVKGDPNKRALRLFELFRSDLLGLLEDYSEEALLQDWIKLSTGERAEKSDFLNTTEEPIVWAEVDYLERALSLRSSLRVTAAKILQKSGLMALLQNTYKFTDYEIDEAIKLVYQTPYDKLYEVPAKVLAYANQCVASEPDYTKRLLKQCYTRSLESKKIVEQIKAGEIKPLNTTDEEVKRELTPEEAQVLAIQSNPFRLELFLMMVEAEKNEDHTTVELVKPILEDIEMEVTADTVTEIQAKTRKNRVASVVNKVLNR